MPRNRPVVTLVKVKDKGEMLCVRTDYDPRLPIIFKVWEGIWDGVKKVWFLPITRKDEVLTLLKDVFGEEPEKLVNTTDTVVIEKVKGKWRGKPPVEDGPTNHYQVALSYVDRLAVVFTHLSLDERDKIVSLLIDKVKEL